MSVTMIPPAGTAPSLVHLPDGSVVTPAAASNWSIQVQPQYVTTMIAAGWSIVQATVTINGLPKTTASVP